MSGNEIGTNTYYKRYYSISKGRHLVASKNIPRGEIILQERPLVSLQSIGNAHTGALVCRCCHCYIGGPDLALAIASGRIKRENVWDYYKEQQSNLEEQHMDCDADDHNSKRTRLNNKLEYSITPCRHNCGELFCSNECENHLWSCCGHDILCTGMIPDPQPRDDEEQNLTFHEQLHPLLRFKMYAVQSNEILLMVADLIATVISLRRQQLEMKHTLSTSNSVTPITVASMEDLLSPYLDFTMEPWWNVACAPMISDPMKIMEVTLLDQTLRQVCKVASYYLKEAVMSFTHNSTQSRVSQSTSHLFKSTLLEAINEADEKYNMFSDDFFGKLIGSFEQNALGIRVKHPLCRDIIQDDDLRQRCHDDIVLCIHKAGMIGDGDCDDDCEIDDAQSDENLEMDSNDNDNNSQGDENILEENNDEQNEMKEHLNYTVDEISDFFKGIEESNQMNDDEAGVWDENMKDEQDELDNIFTPYDGTAMYSITCKMNHSCIPNIIAQYEDGKWGQNYPCVVSCISLRDIAEGEELCISYVDSELDFEERQAALANYGFDCCCDKCKQEKINF